MVCFYIIKLKIKLWEKERKKKTQAKVSAVKIGMVKIVALVMLMIGMNVQAEVFTNFGFKSQQELSETKGIMMIPIKIIGVDSFVARVFFDYSKTTKYTKPTIGLQIPVDEKNTRTVSFESYALTMYQLNQMASELGIKLDYCSQARFNEIFPDAEMTITGNYALCKNNDVIDLNHVINTVQIKVIRN